MKGTRWKNILRQCAGEIHRELKISLTRVPNPEKWIFLAGCYNSGTTLISKILGTHPLIDALPTEGQYLTDQFPSDHEIGLSRMWTQREDLYRLTEKDTGPDVYRIKREWGMRLNGNKRIILEKTPANAARTRWLQEKFENAYFVGIVRNGYAASEGIVRKARPIHTKEGWTIKQAAYQWARSNEILIGDSQHLDHFIWTRYEDLTESPDKEISRILEFLGLADKNSIDMNTNWLVHERNQKIRNMNDESIMRLTTDQIDIISDTAGDILRYFEYPVLSVGKL
jgi:hypothetical protein